MINNGDVAALREWSKFKTIFHLYDYDLLMLLFTDLNTNVQVNEEENPEEMPESESDEERSEAGRLEEPEIRELKYNFHCIEYYK